jgi:hypothetical protein
MSLKMTRRDLATVLGSAASVAAVRAQDPPASQPEDLNAAAKDQLRKDAEAMAKVDLSMSTEPAFQFKA